jgi:hypothetical protein
MAAYEPKHNSVKGWETGVGYKALLFKCAKLKDNNSQYLKHFRDKISWHKYFWPQCSVGPYKFDIIQNCQRSPIPQIEETFYEMAVFWSSSRDSSQFCQTLTEQEILDAALPLQLLLAVTL